MKRTPPRSLLHSRLNPVEPLVEPVNPDYTVLFVHTSALLKHVTPLIHVIVVFVKRLVFLVTAEVTAHMFKVEYALAWYL